MSKEKFEYSLITDGMLLHLDSTINITELIHRNKDGLTGEQASRVRTLYKWSQSIEGGKKYEFFPEAFPHTFAEEKEEIIKWGWVGLFRVPEEKEGYMGMDGLPHIYNGEELKGAYEGKRWILKVEKHD